MKGGDVYISKLLRELRKKANDPEQVEDIINKSLERQFQSKGLGPTKKAYVTDNIMHQLLGEAALDEVEGLADLPLKESLEKSKDIANKGLKELEKSVYVNPKFSVKKLKQAHGLFSPASGIEIDAGFDIPTSKDKAARQLALGTGFHETGHSLDMTAKRIANLENEIEKRNKPSYKLEKIKKVSEGYKPNALEMSTDDELIREYSDVKNKMDNYIKSNPEKMKDYLSSSSIRDYDIMDVPEILPSEFAEMSPTKLQNLYSGTGHWFKRNFPFENLKRTLKEGIKGIKSVSPTALIPAAAAMATAAYAPESKAATITKKVTDEGDPLSLLFPSEAGEGEEEEVMKMREEAKKQYEELNKKKAK
jgi:hypothetical protein